MVHSGKSKRVKLVYASYTFSVTNATFTSKYQTIAKHFGVNLDTQNTRAVVVITFRPKNDKAPIINAETVAKAYDLLLHIGEVNDESILPGCKAESVAEDAETDDAVEAKDVTDANADAGEEYRRNRKQGEGNR